MAVLSTMNGNKEALFAFLLAVSRWGSNGNVAPLMLMLGRVYVEKTFDKQHLSDVQMELDSLKAEMENKNEKWLSFAKVETDALESKQEAESEHQAKEELIQKLKEEQATVKSLQKSYEEALSLVDEELQKNRALDLENKKLENLLEEVKNQAASMDFSDEKDLKVSYEAVLTAKMVLQKSLAEEREKSVKLEKANREALGLRDAESRQNRIFKKEMDRLVEDNKKMAILEVDVRERDASIESLKAKIDEQEKILLDTETEKAELIGRLESEQANNMQGSSRLKELEEMTAQKNALLEDLKDLHTQEQQKVENLQSKTVELESLLDEERERCAGLEKAIADEKQKAIDEDIKHKVIRDESEDLNTKYERVKNTLQGTLDENSFYEKKYNEMKMTLKLAQENAKTWEDQLKLARNENTASSSEHTRILAETNALLNSEKEKTVALHEEIRSLEKAMRDETTNLQYSLERSDALSYEHAKTLEATRKKLAEEKGKALAFEAEIKRLNDSLGTEQIALETLHKLLEDSKGASTEQVQKLGEKEKNLYLEKEKNAALQLQIADLTAMLESEKDSLASLHKLLEDSNARSSGHSNTVDETKKELLTEKAKNAALQRELDRFKSNGVTEKSTVQNLTAKLDESRSLSEHHVKTIENIKMQLDFEKEKNAALQKEISEVNASLTIERGTKDSLLESIGHGSDVSTEDILKEEVMVLNRRLAASKANYKGELEKEKEKSKNLKDEMVRMSGEIGSMKLTMTKLQEKAKSAETELSQLKDGKRHVTASNDTIEKLVETNQKKENLLIQQKAELSALKKELAETMEMLDDGDSTMDPENKMRELQSENKQLKSRVGVLFHKLQAVTKSSNSRIENLEGDKTGIESVLEEKDNKIKSLMDQLDTSPHRLVKEKQSEIDKLREQLITGMVDRKTEEELEKSATRQMQKLQASLDKKETLLIQRKEEMKTLSRKLAEAKDAHKSEIAKVQELELKIERGDFNKEVAKLKALTESQSEYFTELKRRESAMKNEVERVKSIQLSDMMVATSLPRSLVARPEHSS